MIVVIIGVLFTADIIYTRQDFASSGINSSAAISSIINIKLWKQGNYFRLSADSQPLLHFWSLAVEEQYYIFFPFLLWMTFRFWPGIPSHILAFATAVSLVICLVLANRAPDAAFYLLPSRAWELGMGGLIALHHDRLSLAARGSPSKWLPALGLGLVAIACVVLSSAVPYPSLWTVLPASGAVLVLVGTHRSRYFGYEILSSSVMKNIGKYSYSLYLVHWPIFSFVDYSLWSYPEWMRVATKVVLTGFLTIGVSKLVEFPSRIILNRPSNRGLAFGLLAASVVTIGGAGLMIRRANYIDVSPSEIAAGGAAFGDTDARPTILLIGDSNASMYGLSLSRECARRHCRLIVASSAASDALANPGAIESNVWQSSLKLAKRVKPDTIVMVDEWSEKVGADPTRPKSPIRKLLSNTSIL